MVTRNWLFIAVVAILAASQGSAAVAATGVGTVDAVDYERELIVIDGRRYSMGPGVVPRHAGDTQRIVPLRMLRPGMAVRYEVTDTDRQVPRIDQLMLLTGE